MRHLLAVLGLLLLPSLAAQTPPQTPATPFEIRVAAQPVTDSIKLRWAPTNYALWEALWEKGLYVHRYTLLRDGNMLPEAQRTVPTRLNVTPIRPLPEDEFVRIIASDTVRYLNAAIGAQAIYGETFLPRAVEGNEAAAGYANFLNEATELENRFSFGLFAADQDWTAARMMGLAYTDTDVRENEVYLYRIVPATDIPHYDTLRSGFLTVDAADVFPSPKVDRVRGDFGDLLVTVGWSTEIGSDHYSGYHVERSDDGLNWERRNDLPVVPLFDPGDPELALYRDTLPANNRPYFYRIVGITPFGETGTPSDPITGMGLDPRPEVAPIITAVLPLENEGFRVDWGFRSEFPINAFHVLRAKKNEGPYEDISGTLDPAVRNYRDPSPWPTNYYKVVAYDQYDRRVESFSALAQLDDSIPPAPPTDLRGIILEDGDVIVNWSPNWEEDLLGYRVWISNQAEAEYTLVTDRVLGYNFYVGNTTLNTLSRELYVKVTALDYRHNPSEFTDYVALLRPDTIAPAPPLLKEIVAGTDSMTLYWANSETNDVAKHELYRRPLGDTSWQLLATYTVPQELNVTSYTERELEPGEDHEYRLVAVDHAGLSAPSESLTGRRIDDFVRAPVAGVRGSADRENENVRLVWRYDPGDKPFSHFEVYRARTGEPTVTLARFDPEAEAVAETTTRRARRQREQGRQYTFVDDIDLRRDTDYDYQIRAIYADGGLSPLSELITVNY